MEGHGIFYLMSIEREDLSALRSVNS